MCKKSMFMVFSCLAKTPLSFNRYLYESPKTWKMYDFIILSAYESDQCTIFYIFSDWTVYLKENRSVQCGQGVRVLEIFKRSSDHPNLKCDCTVLFKDKCIIYLFICTSMEQSLSVLEIFKRNRNLFNVKCNCTLLFSNEMYWLLVYCLKVFHRSSLLEFFDSSKTVWNSWTSKGVLYLFLAQDRIMRLKSSNLPRQK